MAELRGSVRQILHARAEAAGCLLSPPFSSWDFFTWLYISYYVSHTLFVSIPFCQHWRSGRCHRVNATPETCPPKPTKTQLLGKNKNVFSLRLWNSCTASFTVTKGIAKNEIRFPMISSPLFSASKPLLGILNTSHRR